MFPVLFLAVLSTAMSDWAVSKRNNCYLFIQIIFQFQVPKNESIFGSSSSKISEVSEVQVLLP